MNFGVFEGGSKFDGRRLHDGRGLSGQDVRKRGSAAGGEVVGRAHEEVQVALERAGLGEGGFEH